jgi:hypothetical protein
MDKIIVISLLILMAGCTSQPMPNITIGGAEGCPDGDVTLNIFTDIDKVTLGDESEINDADAGMTQPTLGL